MRPKKNTPALAWFLLALAMNSSAVASDTPPSSGSGSHNKTLKLPPNEEQAEEELAPPAEKSNSKKHNFKETKKAHSDHNEHATTQKPTEHEQTNDQPKLLKLPGDNENEDEESSSHVKKDTHNDTHNDTHKDAHKTETENEKSSSVEHGEEEKAPHDTKKPLVHTTDKAIPENSGSGLTWFTVVFSALVMGIFVFT